MPSTHARAHAQFRPICLHISHTLSLSLARLELYSEPLLHALHQQVTHSASAPSITHECTQWLFSLVICQPSTRCIRMVRARRCITFTIDEFCSRHLCRDAQYRVIQNSTTVKEVKVFPCTVGRQPSVASYCLYCAEEVFELMSGLFLQIKRSARSSSMVELSSGESMLCMFQVCVSACTVLKIFHSS